jgi:hypothetical protein
MQACEHRPHGLIKRAKDVCLKPLFGRSSWLRALSVSCVLSEFLSMTLVSQVNQTIQRTRAQSSRRVLTHAQKHIHFHT